MNVVGQIEPNTFVSENSVLSRKTARGPCADHADRRGDHISQARNRSPAFLRG